MGNTFGHLFRITTFGESHGGGVGVIIDGCPPQVEISAEEIQAELDRRRPGQSKITTPRKESDRCEILSGVFQGKTLGTPISILVRNKDARPQDYSEMATAYRPSHADATYDAKYGIRNYQGGGRSSARETIGRVAAGAIAKKILHQYAGVEVIGYVKRIQDIEAPIDPSTVTLAQVESNIVRCPDGDAAQRMIDRVEQIRDQGDSIGGVVECVARQVPKGLGAPVFDKLEADLAKGVMSLPASKGFELGSGFAGTLLTGSEHNDEFYTDDQGDWRTRTNRSGGTQGGYHQRRRCGDSSGLQAHRHHSQSPKYRDPRRGRNGVGGSGSPRSLRLASGGTDGGSHGGFSAVRSSAAPPWPVPLI
jgi:chorismate synthase